MRSVTVNETQFVYYLKTLVGREKKHEQTTQLKNKMSFMQSCW